MGRHDPLRQHDLFRILVLHHQLDLKIVGTLLRIPTQNVREIDRSLHLFGAIAILPSRPFYPYSRTCRKLRGNGLGSPMGKRIGLLAPAQRQGKHPIRTDSFIIDKLPSFQHDTLVINRHQQPLFTILLIHHRHLIGGLLALSIHIGVLPTATSIRVAQRGGADAHKVTLPDAVVILQDRVGMAGEGDAVRETAQGCCRLAIVLAPGPRTIAGVSRMGMLDIEEGLLSLQFSPMRLQEGRHAFDMLPVAPMGSDEFVALHLFQVDGLVFFLEIFLPDGCPVVCDSLFPDQLLLLLLGDNAGQVVMMALHVMIAIHKQLLDPTAVRGLVFREDPVPGRCHSLQLAFQTGIGHVTRNDDTIGSLVVKIAECLLQGFRMLGMTDMDITHDTDAQFRISQLRGHLGK